MSGLNIWFTEDVEARLNAIELVVMHLEPGPFQSGYLAAIQAVRAAFGLPVGRQGLPQILTRKEIQSVQTGQQLDFDVPALGRPFGATEKTGS